MANQIKRGKRRVKQETTWGAEDSVVRDYGRYPHKLQFYVLPPEDEVSLEEFETLAIERLKVLKYVETAKVRWPKRGGEFDSYVRDKIKSFMPAESKEDDQRKSYDQRRQDHVSHFILRLAYCRTEDLRRWFLTQECELFRYRLEKLSPKEVTDFLQVHQLSYEMVDDATKESLATQLAAAGFKLNEQQVKRETYFQVPFEQALELVRNRRAYLRNGYAYVARGDMTSIVVGAFRSKMSASLAMTARALPQLEEDSRLLPMLTSLSKQYLGKEYGTTGSKAGQVTPGDVPGLSKESFPLCMRTIQDHLSSTHHLRHGGRMQYGLFLKGIGLSLEDALAFWRSEFSKAMSSDKFDKQYAYNIRHNYGKEGKRANYTPYSCMKIIMGTAPGSGDTHGCPFRHFDPQQLRDRLVSYRVPAKGINELLNLVKGQHYQLACGRYYELTHDVENTNVVIQHPNQYFDESRKLRTNGEHVSTETHRRQAPVAMATEQEEDVDEDALMAAMEMAEAEA
eukprot:TRINITY_DN5091_c0_g1_i2.p1 TRINITY_DN5091_c0_g1~~TRINITY_DN5091_c0_g1_i2.p1  ORF type:complete len:510 (+),score=121.63 TRINITY_DN5091_c0_g1_i2:46-1575(+)